MMNTYGINNWVYQRDFFITTEYTLEWRDQTMIANAYIYNTQERLFNDWKQSNPDEALSEDQTLKKKKELFKDKHVADLPILLTIPTDSPEPNSEYAPIKE